jgi:hypothetical protein
VPARRALRLDRRNRQEVMSVDFYRVDPDGNIVGLMV